LTYRLLAGAEEEGTLRRLPRLMKDRLVAAAREVDLDPLPIIPRPGRPRRRPHGNSGNSRA
jgi:hypothetical protein